MIKTLKKRKICVLGPSIFLLIFLLAITAISQAKVNSHDILGKWESTYEFGGVELSGHIKFFVDYKKNGIVVCKGMGGYKQGDRQATYEFVDISKWEIDGLYLVETTIERVYFNIKGDKSIVDIINSFSEHEDEKENRSEIINSGYP